MRSCVQLYDPIPSRLLCPWGFSSKNTRVGCHFLLQGNLPDPGIEPMSLVSPALAGGFFTSSATWGAPAFTRSQSSQQFLLKLCLGSVDLKIYVEYEV